MGTLTSFLESARYDLLDYETGLEFDDRELLVYLNRMIGVMDSILASLSSELVHGTETELDSVISTDYLDLTTLNNGNWDSLCSVWDDTTRLSKVSNSLMHYKRKFISATLTPSFWTVEGRLILFEGSWTAASTDMIIHYHKKHRALLEGYSDTITATVATDILTPSAAHTFVTGDGPFQISNSGGALPTGLSASTDYWIIFEPDVGNASFQFATSKTLALQGTNVTLTGTGSGTNTVAFTVSDMLPFDGIYDELFREMLVMHAKAKKEGEMAQPEQFYQAVFNKRATEETIRKGFIPKMYSTDF